jgi:hypothetical protein
MMLQGLIAKVADRVQHYLQQVITSLLSLGKRRVATRDRSAMESLLVGY